MNKLIIWDFDGVIADTEHLSMKTWQKKLKYYGIKWSIEETVKNIMGTGQKISCKIVGFGNMYLKSEFVKKV